MKHITRRSALLMTLSFATAACSREEPAPPAFDPPLYPNETPELRAEADRAFNALHRAVAAVVAMVPPERRPPTLMAAMHIWTLSHGVATLFGRGARPSPMTPEEMLESAVGVYLRGLGVLGG